MFMAILYPQLYSFSYRTSNIDFREGEERVLPLAVISSLLISISSDPVSCHPTFSCQLFADRVPADPLPSGLCLLGGLHFTDFVEKRVKCLKIVAQEILESRCTGRALCYTIC